MSEEYRQMPLSAFNTMEALREYLIPKEESRDAAASYVLAPKNFLDAIERVESVDFRYLSSFFGQVLFNRKNFDNIGRPKVELIMATNSSHARQAETLAHEMAHVDRRQNLEHNNERLVEFFFSGRDVEEEIVTVAGKDFYESHTSLAQLALCQVWERYETELALENSMEVLGH